MSGISKECAVVHKLSVCDKFRGYVSEGGD
jgi:hypothetical protein